MSINVIISNEKDNKGKSKKLNILINEYMVRPDTPRKKIKFHRISLIFFYFIYFAIKYEFKI